MESSWVNYLGIPLESKVLLRSIMESCIWRFDEFGKLPIQKGVDLNECFVNSKLNFDRAYTACKSLENNDLIYIDRDGPLCTLYLTKVLKFIKGSMEDKGYDKEGTVSHHSYLKIQELVYSLDPS